MTQSDQQSSLTGHQTSRRYLRRRGGAGAFFFPLGLIPALGLALLTLFALFPFANAVIEDRARDTANEALIEGGEPWAIADASGQWVTLEGRAPTAARAARAVTLVREARTPTWLGSARPITKVLDLTTLAVGNSEPGEAANRETVSERSETAPTSEPITGDTSAPGDLDQCNQQLVELLEQTKFRFASSSATVGPENEPLLGELTTALDRCPGRIVIAGHTDSTGSESTNRALSLARAQAIRDALLDRGIGVGRMSARGFGSDQPLDVNTTAEGRARNRRIEIELVGPRPNNN